jgi:hypothetical protein
VGGQWLFSQVKVNMAFITPYETGWVKERVVSSYRLKEKDFL